VNGEIDLAESREADSAIADPRQNPFVPSVFDTHNISSVDTPKVAKFGKSEASISLAVQRIAPGPERGESNATPATRDKSTLLKHLDILRSTKTAASPR